MKLKTTLSITLIFATILTPAPQPSHAAITQDKKTDDASKSGLRFRLSEVKEVARPTPTPNAVAKSAPLSQAKTERLLARLPPVGRVYEAVDDAKDVSRDAEGVWHIRAGSRVRVRVHLLNPARRYHVALVDPLPAGLEALNPELATTGNLPDESSESNVYRGGRGVVDYYWLWRGPWYDHQNLRDDRAEAFTALLWEGEHEYSYFARATTPGLFVAPPSKAEEMYSPETFGRGQTDRVRVE
jgi:uncharacterized protein YfaS (alpha-2-macroglobulin family)